MRADLDAFAAISSSDCIHFHERKWHKFSLTGLGNNTARQPGIVTHSVNSTMQILIYLCFVFATKA